MEHPLFGAVPEGPPAVGLVSGPGPSPARDPLPAGQCYLAGRHVVDDVDDGLLMAQLAQYEPGLGRRGWRLYVCTTGTGGAAEWPIRHISRPGTRPPLIAARIAALAELGYELANGPSTAWDWYETTTVDGRLVSMYAVTAVRPLPRVAAAAAATSPSSPTFEYGAPPVLPERN